MQLSIHPKSSKTMLVKEAPVFWGYSVFYINLAQSSTHQNGNMTQSDILGPGLLQTWLNFNTSMDK